MAELKLDTGFRVFGQYLSQSDNKYRANSIQVFFNYSESRVEFYLRLWLNFLCQNDSIFSFVDRSACFLLLHTGCQLYLTGLYCCSAPTVSLYSRSFIGNLVAVLGMQVIRGKFQASGNWGNISFYLPRTRNVLVMIEKNSIL